MLIFLTILRLGAVCRLEMCLGEYFLNSLHHNCEASMKMY